MVLCVWFDEVVPLAMKLVALEIYALHLLVSHRASYRIFAPVQSARDFKSLRSGCPGMPWQFLCAPLLPLTQIALATRYLYSDGHEWTPIMLFLGCCSLAELESATTALRKQTHSVMPLRPIKSTPTATLCSLLPNRSYRR